MASKKLTGILIILLLLFSIVSAALLSIRQSTQRSTVSFNKIPTVSNNYIGVIDISGPIYSANSSGGFSMRYRVPDILHTLKDYRERKSIKGVILRINSPGGTVGAVQEIVREVNRVKKAGKPVVASVSDIAASGGYYIASVCDRIVVNPGSIVGSIGVIFTTAEMSELFKKVGIDFEVIKSGPYKDVGSSHRPLKTEERKFLQEVIDDTYDQFVVAVSSGRNMEIDKVKKLGKGQIYSGRQAKKLNLVDEFGDLNTAKDIVESMAEIDNAKLFRPRYPGWKQFFNLMEQKTNLFGLNKNRINGAAYLYRP